jgi:hypothetical protein
MYWVSGRVEKWDELIDTKDPWKCEWHGDKIHYGAKVMNED